MRLRELQWIVMVPYASFLVLMCRYASIWILVHPNESF